MKPKSILLYEIDSETWNIFKAKVAMEGKTIHQIVTQFIKDYINIPK
jgi:hypothetical protein